MPVRQNTKKTQTLNYTTHLCTKTFSNIHHREKKRETLSFISSQRKTAENTTRPHVSVALREEEDEKERNEKRTVKIFFFVFFPPPPPLLLKKKSGKNVNTDENEMSTKGRTHTQGVTKGQDGHISKRKNIQFVFSLLKNNAFIEYYTTTTTTTTATLTKTTSSASSARRFLREQREREREREALFVLAI